MKNEIMVSIDCLAYNHEKYITEAIESFLMQKTNFKFEILIHDDASTDRTADIIREYEKKYPDLIKPIYQLENQYSKGGRVNRFNTQRAKGKYIASCEGDDYWTDPYKLQKQVDYMEQHPECSLCVHAADMVSPDKEKLKVTLRPNHGDKIFSVEEVIAGGGGLFATNSRFYRAIFNKSMPDFYHKAPVGDYPLAIYLALQGKVYYMDEFMSAYRVNVKGSWTDKEFSNIEKKIDHFNRIAYMLNEVNRYSNYKYSTVIESTKKRNQFNLLLAQNMFEDIKTSEFREFYISLSLRNKISITIKQNFPKISENIIKLKRKYTR